VIRFWHLPPHINENKLPDPFKELLKDTPLRVNPTKYEKAEDAFKVALKWVRKAQALCKQAIAEAIAEERPYEIPNIERIIALGKEISTFIKKVSKEGIKNEDAEHAILSSSWLYAGIVSWGNMSMDTNEYSDRVHSFISQVTLLLVDPLLPSLALTAVLCLRYALLLLPETINVTPEVATSGTLKVSILKRYAPKRMYGPYHYPNVPNNTWKEMQSAVGSYGTGAGTIFWRRYLDRFYSKITTGNRRFN